MVDRATNNAELMARALACMQRVLPGGCARSGALAAFCLGCLARDEGYPEPVREACGQLRHTLRNWAALGMEDRAECAPWLLALPAALHEGRQA